MIEIFERYRQAQLRDLQRRTEIPREAESPPDDSGERKVASDQHDKRSDKT